MAGLQERFIGVLREALSLGRSVLDQARIVSARLVSASGGPPRHAQHAAVLGVGLAVTVLATGPARVDPAVGNTPALAHAVSLEATPADSDQVLDPVSEVLGETRVDPLSTYQIQPGDTLLSIALSHDISVESLIWANSIEAPELILPGNALIIPAVSGLVYTVQRGDSLGLIAQRHGVSITEIAATNGLDGDLDLLPLEARLVIPGARRAQPAPLVASRAPAPQAVVVGGDLRAMAVLAPLPEEGSGSALQQAVVAPPLVQPSPSSPPARRVPASVTYTVEEGDTLGLLTQLFGIDLRTILDTNDIENGDLIKVGTELSILPVSGLEHEVQRGETLADIAARYEVDLGPILDFNDLPDPDLILVGKRLVVPGAVKPRPQPTPVPVSAAAAPRVGPAAPAAARAAAPPPGPLPQPNGSFGDFAMKFVGYRYVWGGTSPAGFDCSGFVWYVYKMNGKPISRGLWGQLNAGPRIPASELRPGDIVFFANTYMPGLSHDGIYVGGGQFVHASDPSKGVTVSSMSQAYWSSRYVGASRP